MTDARTDRRTSTHEPARLALWTMGLCAALAWSSMLSLSAVAQDKPADAEREAAEDADADSALINRANPRRAQALDLNQTDEILAIIRDVHPDLAQRMADVQQRSPDQLKKRLRPHLEWVSSLYRLKQLDAKLYELRASALRLKRGEEQAVVALQSAYKSGSQEKIDTAREDLRSVIAQQFDVQQSLRDRELERLKARLQQLIAQADRDKANRKKLIDDRVIELDPIRKP